VRCVGSLVHA